MTETRFVTCPDCDGMGEKPIGVWVHEPGCGYGHMADDAVPCLTCAGTGRAEQEVKPVECDDDQYEAEARAYCARNGLDPDDDAADGVLVWQVVAKEQFTRGTGP